LALFLYFSMILIHPSQYFLFCIKNHFAHQSPCQKPNLFTCILLSIKIKLEFLFWVRPLGINPKAKCLPNKFWDKHNFLVTDWYFSPLPFPSSVQCWVPILYFYSSSINSKSSSLRKTFATIEKNRLKLVQFASLGRSHT